MYYKNADVFDRIEVQVGLLQSWFGKDVINKLRPYTKRLNRLVMHRVSQHHYVQSRPGLIDCLEISRIDVLPCWALLYTIEPKVELKRLMLLEEENVF